MDKFMHFVEDKMSPIADKLGEQRHLSAMQKGFMTVLPLIFEIGRASCRERV